MMGSYVGATPCGCLGVGRHGGLPLQTPLQLSHCRPGITLALLLCLVMLLSACTKKTEPEQDATVNKAVAGLTLTAEQQDAIGLATEKVATWAVRPVIESFGRVIPRPHGRVQVVSPIAGRITTQSAGQIPKLGAVVRVGQQLAEVEQTYTAPEQVQLEVGAQAAGGAEQEAKAALDAAAAEYRRSQQLLQAKIISRKRLEEAHAAWLQAQSRLQTAQQAQASYRAATATATEKRGPRRFPLTASLTGVVVQAEATAGQQVDATMPLFTIADLATVWIDAAIFEGDLGRVDRNSTVVVHGGSDEQATWTGAPVYAGEVIDPLKRSASLFYAVDNSEGRLKLGMSVLVAVPAGPEASVTMVPEAALIETGGGKGVVYVRRSPTLFAEEEVAIGLRRDGRVAVTGAVHEGDEVVVAGAPELFGQTPGRLPEAED
ncbi:MAG: efflux RND transporter periplasmic adaptor subunit [Deltaproteobacteria bacterium]|nr:efflux RND transporter periplasmic adaptor subunit [Deltaproteobacteria bacterium]